MQMFSLICQVELIDELKGCTLSDFNLPIACISIYTFARDLNKSCFILCRRVFLCNSGELTNIPLGDIINKFQQLYLVTLSVGIITMQIYRTLLW